jgi:uncharacterized MAPEG superfamily protein
MTLPFWCVLIAAFMPYLATVIAKSRRDYDNANPREWLARQDGFRGRAHAAQQNSFEAFPAFAAAVIIAHIRGAAPGPIELLAMAFIAARVLYLAFYLADLAVLRSLAWFAASGCALAMFFVS